MYFELEWVVKWYRFIVELAPYMIILFTLSLKRLIILIKYFRIQSASPLFIIKIPAEVLQSSQ
jgi:hypothetical protein